MCVRACAHGVEPPKAPLEGHGDGSSEVEYIYIIYILYVYIHVCQLTKVRKEIGTFKTKAGCILRPLMLITSRRRTGLLPSSYSRYLLPTPVSSCLLPSPYPRDYSRRHHTHVAVSLRHSHIALLTSPHVSPTALPTYLLAHNVYIYIYMARICTHKLVAWAASCQYGVHTHTHAPHFCMGRTIYSADQLGI